MPVEMLTPPFTSQDPHGKAGIYHAVEEHVVSENLCSETCQTSLSMAFGC